MQNYLIPNKIDKMTYIHYIYTIINKYQHFHQI